MAAHLVLVAIIAFFLVPSIEIEIHDDFQNKCLSFAPEVYIHNSTRQILQYVAAGTNLTFPYDDPTCDRPSQLVSADLCRVALSIPTSNRSSITFELWLPDQWSGRFLATGNGGIDGCPYGLNFVIVELALAEPRSALTSNVRHQIRGPSLRD